MTHASLRPTVVAVAALLAASHAMAQGAAPPGEGSNPQPGSNATGPAPAPASGATVTLGGSAPARGPGGPQADQGTTEPEEEKPEEKPSEPLKWRGTSFIWSNTTTTDTVGVGRDRQSRNPTYDMTFTVNPRWYLHTDADQNYSLRGSAGAFREFTNSDTTTERGQWSATDATLTTVYLRKVYSENGYTTLAGFSAPSLSFPTSVPSRHNGMILGAGGSLVGVELMPVLGKDAPVMNTAMIIAGVGYNHTFTKAQVAVDGDLNRFRQAGTDVQIANDQLSGAPLAKHQLQAFFSGSVDIVGPAMFNLNLGFNPSWSYRLNRVPEPCDLPNVDLCTPSDQVDRVDDSQNYSVITSFSASVSVFVVPQLSIAAGYNNTALQLGPDGQRRSFFRSPGARFFLNVTAFLDRIYQAIESGGAGGGRQLAKAPSTSSVQ